MISYDEFCKELKFWLEDFVAKHGKYEVIYERSPKTNSYRDAFVLRDKEAPKYTTNISFYFDEMYKKYLDGTSYESIVLYAKQLTEKHKRGKFYQIDFEGVLSGIEKNTCLELIHTKQNEELLKNVPHREFLDMSVVCKLYVSEPYIEGTGTICITNKLLENTSLSEEKLFSLAKENTLRIKDFSIYNINEVIYRPAYESMPIQECSFEEFCRRLGIEDSPLYIATSKDKFKGASIMLYEDILYEFAQKLNSNLYILPSSVHEVLLCKTEGAQLWALKDMVPEINASELDLQERLSNQVYYFDKDTKEISIVTDNRELLEGYEEELDLD